MTTLNLISNWNKGRAAASHCETSDLREQLVGEMVSFMRLCDFSYEHVNVLNIVTVAESAHRPIRGFWQAFEFSMMVLEALDRHLPRWRSLPPEMGMAMPPDRFILEIRRQMKMNAFDEANAERFFAQPAAMRPTSAKAALVQIRADLAHIGAFASLAAVNADGGSAGTRAYELYQCIDAADKGKSYLTSFGKTVADCRDAAHKRITEHGGTYTDNKA